jgi:hypothetical protein
MEIPLLSRDHWKPGTSQTLAILVHSCKPQTANPGENSMHRRFAQWLLLASLFPVTLMAVADAAKDPFVGKWKLDPARSRLTDTMKVMAAGPNKYSFNFSADNVETITIDGTDQPGLYGSTLAVSAEAPETWKVVRKTNGKTSIIGIWKLSADGKTLTDDFTSYRPDGSTFHLLYTYQRAEGAGNGFTGTWESVTEDVNSSYELTIAPFQQSGLSFIYPFGINRSLNFDGKDYAVTGPSSTSGYVASGQRSNARTLDLVNKINGKTLDTMHIELSPDGQTMTVTDSPAGRSKPNIMVFARQ